MVYFLPKKNSGRQKLNIQSFDASAPHRQAMTLTATSEYDK